MRPICACLAGDDLVMMDGYLAGVPFTSREIWEGKLMRRFLVVMTLFLTVVAAAGCRNIDPDVIKGGGETVTVDATGVISVSGHVVNVGNARANEVTLTFSFSQQGAVYLQQAVYLGTVHAGELRGFNATFYGPAVDLATFAWDYSIDWE